MTSMREPTVVNRGEDLINLPPGFRFHPTDEEIITHYLREKVLNSNFSAAAIGEADLNKCEPWDLPKRAKMGEKEFYFFCQRDRKYPTGMRTNRATESGYWKATGKDKEIFKDKSCLVGMKKTLVFYKGRAPRGEKTNWVMHEFRLEGKFSYYNLPKSARDEWVVGRIFHKSTGSMIKKPMDDLLRMNSLENIDHLLDFSSLPPLMDPSFSGQPGSSFSAAENGFKPMNNNNQNHIPESIDLYQTPNNQMFNLGAPIQNPNVHHQAGLNPNPASCYGDGQAVLMKTLASRNPNEAFRNGEKKIKMEQFSSNHSMVTVSQDTGLSSDVNATPEISSGLIPKQKMIGGSSKYYEDLEDLGILWDYGYNYN